MVHRDAAAISAVRQGEHRRVGESTGRELRGHRAIIEVKSIDEDRHQIEFRLVEHAGSPIAPRERA